MKHILNLILFASSLMVMQACGSKSENNAEASVAKEDSIKAKNKEVKLTLDEKRVQLDKETAIREERRMLAMEEKIKTSATYVDSKGKTVYHKAEVDPSFTGGKDAMMKYLNDNIQFPKNAEAEELEGTVFVDFVIAENGNVEEVNVIDAPGEEVDQRFRDEAIRVVSAMPKWIPGKQHGKPVAVRYSLPIAFQIR